MRTHQEIREKPRKRFECDLCEYKTAIKRNLARHRMTHTGERPFQCDVCDFSASQRAGLITHMRMHNGEKPFQCEHFKDVIKEET